MAAMTIDELDMHVRMFYEGTATDVGSESLVAVIALVC